MIQAYIDDSGTRGTHPIFTMAGFIGEAEKWVSLSNAWHDHLQAQPSIRYLKMAEAVKLSRQFRNWKPCERDEKLKGFVEVIKTHTPQKAIHFTVDLQAFEQHMAAHAPMSDPMFTGCYVILAGVCHEVLDSGPPQQIEVIFDEHVIVGPRVKLWYPIIKANFKGREEYDLARLADVLPPEPMFKSDEEYLPLQAADVIAWLFRTAFSGERHEFEWIAEELRPVIPMSSYSSVFDAKRMERIHEMSLEMTFPPDVIRAGRKQLGLPRKKKSKRVT